MIFEAPYAGDECLALCSEAKPEHFEAVYDSSSAREAWAMACNLKFGLEKNRDAITTDDLEKLKWSLFEQFERLGVSSSVAMAIMSSFRFIDEVAAEKKLN